MTDLLCQLVQLESPSLDIPAQQAIQARLREVLEAMDFRVLHVRGPRSGGHLLARPKERRGRPAQLILGHSDTVWPRGTLQSMPLQVDHHKLQGPGAYDMKGGLVIALFALQALRSLGLQPELCPYLLINSDEEVGSRESARWIHRLAPQMTRALVCEPSLGLEGRLKTERKGVAGYQLLVQGRSAHAGLDPESGASAILALSHLVQQLHALNDGAQGISVNVGTVEGGLRANVIAPQARAAIDVRVPTQAAAQAIDQALRQLDPKVAGVEWSLSGGLGRPPLEANARNQALWQQALRLGHELDLHLQPGRAGGGSDGSLTGLHCATLDGLGPVGDGAHASHEFVLLESLPQRAALLALLILQPGEEAP